MKSGRSNFDYGSLNFVTHQSKTKQISIKPNVSVRSFPGARIQDRKYRINGINKKLFRRSDKLCYVKVVENVANHIFIHCSLSFHTFKHTCINKPYCQRRGNTEFNQVF